MNLSDTIRADGGIAFSVDSAGNGGNGSTPGTAGNQGNGAAGGAGGVVSLSAKGQIDIAMITANGNGGGQILNEAGNGTVTLA